MAYTIRELSRMLDVSESCIRKWIRAGKINVIDDDIYVMRIEEYDLVDFLLENKKYKTKLKCNTDPFSRTYYRASSEFYNKYKDKLEVKDNGHL